MLECSHQVCQHKDGECKVVEDVYKRQSYVRGDWNYPLGIAVDDNGNVYVADPGMGYVIRETLSNGNYTGTTQVGNFDYPYELALTPAGNLVVADNGANEGGLGLSNGNDCCAVKSLSLIHI